MKAVALQLVTLRGSRHVLWHLTTIFAYRFDFMSQSWPTSSSTREIHQKPTRSSPDTMASQTHSNSSDRQTFQPYPRAKPRKFTIYPHSSNSKHSVNATKSTEMDASHYLKPKSRLKIAWSNENRTMTRAASGRHATAQDTSKNAFSYRNNPENHTLHSSIAINDSPIQSRLSTGSKVVTEVLAPLSPHTDLFSDLFRSQFRKTSEYKSPRTF